MSNVSGKTQITERFLKADELMTVPTLRVHPSTEKNF